MNIHRSERKNTVQFIYQYISHIALIVVVITIAVIIIVHVNNIIFLEIILFYQAPISLDFKSVLY
jgi:hypothetical protein